MLPTITQILDDIDARLPNTQSQATKIGWLNDTIREIWKFTGTTDLYEFDTVAGQAVYSKPSNMRMDKIKNFVISASTTIDGTESYNTYTYAGPEDSLEGDRYYEAIGQIGIYPVPSTATGGGYRGKITYGPVPPTYSTNSLATTPEISEDYHDVLKWRVCRDVASAGHAPDIELANNYAAMYNALFDQLRMDFYKKKAKTPKARFSYKEGWWNG